MAVDHLDVFSHADSHGYRLTGYGHVAIPRLGDQAASFTFSYDVPHPMATGLWRI